MRYNNYHKHDHKGNVRTIDTITKLEDYCKRAKELGHTTIFTTNHGMQGDIFEATTLAKQYDLKLIIGCETYYVDDRFSKDKSNKHLVVIALNDNGAKKLNKTLTIANKEGFYYKPRIDHELLMSLNPNDFIITSACVAGILNNEELVKELSEKFKEHFFLEVQNHNEDVQKEWNKKALCLKKKYNIGLIHGNDSHYIFPEDSRYRDLFLKAKGYKYEDENNFILDYPDSDTIIERYKKQGILNENEIMEALNNTLIFDNAEQLTFINDEIKLPKVSDNPNRELNEIIVKEWNKEKKNILKEKHKEYLDAIKYEMKIIKDTHMENYFILDYKMAKLGQEKYGGRITNTGRGCFTKDALVHTNTTIKSIKDVKVGDKVITKDGKFERVYNTMSYDIEEELVQIKHLYGTDKYYPTICTLNHKIFVNRNGKLMWVQAKDVLITDYVCVPKVKIEERIFNIIDLNDYNDFGFGYDDEYIYETVESTGKPYKYSPSDIAKKIGVGKSIIENFAKIDCKKSLFIKKPEKLKELMEYIPFKTREEYAEFIKNKKTRKIKRFIKIDKIFNIFIGLMYGDGFTTSDDRKVGLAINSETDKNFYNRNIYEQIANRLNIDIYENKSKSRNLSQLYIKSKVFTTFIKKELFESKKGKEKIFNPKWFKQDIENLEGIIEGLIKSDGHIDERINFDNTSKSILNAYKILCLMTSKGVNSLSVRPARIDYRGYKCKESFKMRINPNSENSQKKFERTFQDESYYYLPVKEVKILPKTKTKVYDISVENEPSYLLNNMIVHNSAVSFYVNKLLRLTNIDRLDSCIKLFPTRFMSTTRILQTRSLPDVDVNTVSRYPFIKATEELLGKEHCAWMLSWKPLQESSAFRLYCKSLDMPPSSYNEVAKDLDNYRNNPEWKDIIEESERFVGVVETMSESPCSMLIYDKNIDEEIGLIRLKDDSGEDKYCCLLDGYNCDKYKYLKNDLLQVIVWGIIKDTFDLIGKPIPTIKEFEGLLNDKTWEIYEKGLTSTINQVDSEWATDLVKRYKPRTISEMSSFVAAIRPGFASLLDNFIDRKPYTTGVKELDDLLEDSFHYLLYQESIMKYLVWLGIDESETYDIIKKISKKKFKEKELKELKEKLIKGWIKKIGSEEGFEKTWQVIQDAAHYSFNASHSLSYAYDSLYGAYLKGNYPLEYYTVALNYYIGDSERTSRLIKEMEYFNININQPKFRHSKAKYMCNKENKSIYKGIESVKYLNEEVSDELYNKYKDKEFNSFVELIHTLKNETSITSRQFEILIYLNYFSEFGKNKKLLMIFEKYMNKLKNKNLKQETKDKRLLELIEYEKTVENKAVDIKTQIEKEKEYLGYEVTKKENLPSNVYIISEINDKSTPKLRLYCLKTGEVENVKCYKKTIKQKPFGKFSVIKKKAYKQSPKRKLNENGEWVKSETEFEEILTDYDVIM